jgi:hypothetical protein
MILRVLLISTTLFAGIWPSAAQTNTPGLAFGQVYGAAGFRSQDTRATMADAPNVVLAFTAMDGHRNLVLTQQTGDYVAVLEPGRYCIAAYTRAPVNRFGSRRTS